MTDRLKGVYVAFERDMRDDDAETIIHAIQMIKGVKSVKGNIVDSNDWMNREQIKAEIKAKLFELYENI